MIRPSTILVEPFLFEAYSSANFTIVPGEKEDAAITKCDLTLTPEDGGDVLTKSSTSPVNSEFVFTFRNMQDGVKYTVEAVVFNAREPEPFVQSIVSEYTTGAKNTLDMRIEVRSGAARS